MLYIPCWCNERKKIDNFKKIFSNVSSVEVYEFMKANTFNGINKIKKRLYKQG